MKHSAASKVGFRCRICQKRFDSKDERYIKHILILYFGLPDASVDWWKKTCNWNFTVCPTPPFFGGGGPMPPHVLVDFVVLPPGHGRSVTDFCCWGAHEAQLHCPHDVSGDRGRSSARRALKPKFY